MKDLISRQTAIDIVNKYKKSHMILWGKPMVGAASIVIELEELPPAQPERKKGKWNAYYHGINETPSFTYSCNQCGYSAPYGLYGGKYSQKEWNFCPNCGAKMRGEQDG